MKSKLPMISLLATASLAAGKPQPPCPAADLKPASVRKGDNPSLTSTDITLTVPKNTPYASLMKVLEACMSVGLGNVTISTTPAKKTVEAPTEVLPHFATEKVARP